MILDRGAGIEPVLSRSKSHIYGSTSGAAAGSGGDEVDNHLHTVNLLQFQSSQTIYNIHLTFCLQHCYFITPMLLDLCPCAGIKLARDTEREKDIHHAALVCRCV